MLRVQQATLRTVLCLAAILPRDSLAEKGSRPPLLGVRIAFVLSNGSADVNLESSVLGSLSNELSVAGARVVDIGANKAVRASWSLADLDLGKLPQELSALDADYAIYVLAIAADQGVVRKSQFHSAEATVNVRLVEVDTARIVFSDRASSTVLALSFEQAAQRAANEAAKKLSSPLRKGLEDAAAQPRELDLLVQGADSLSAVRHIAESLRTLDVVRDVVVSTQGAKVARFVVYSSFADPMRFAAAIEDALDIPLRLVQISHGSMVARYLPIRGRRLGVRVDLEGPRSPAWAWLSDALPQILAAQLTNTDYLVAKDQADAPLRLSVKLVAMGKDDAALTLEARAGVGRRLSSVSAKLSHAEAVSEVNRSAEELLKKLQAALRKQPDLVVGLAQAELELDADALQLEVENLEAILPSRLGAYADAGLLGVRLRNTGSAPLRKVRLSLALPGLSKVASEREIGELAPAQVVELRMPAVLDTETVLQFRNTRPAQVVLEGTAITDDDGRIRQRRVVTTVVYGINAVDWRATANAAAFVTPSAKVIEELAAQLMSAPVEGVPREIERPLRAVDGLAQLGLRYAPDTEQPYRSSSIDHIQLPGETLTKGQGDCDDLTVLMAAVLEAMGCSTALLATPSHLLLAVDTGVSAKARGRVPYVGPGWIEYAGSLWVPLEATLVAKGFWASWNGGADEVARSGSKTEKLATRDAWNDFPPLPAKQLEAGGQKMNEVALRSRLAASSTQVQRWLTEITTREEQELQARAGAGGEGALDAKVALALLYARVGRHQEARKILEAVRAALGSHRPEAAGKVLELLGCLHLAEGASDKALAFFVEAEKRGVLSAGGYINLGLAYLARGARGDAKRAFASSANRGGKPALKRLAKTDGPDSNPTPGAKDSPTVPGRDVKSLLDEVLNKLPAGKGEHGEVLPLAGRRGDFAEAVPLAGLLQWPE